MVDNKIGAEGAKTMSEMLRVNTTLTEMDLCCVKDIKRREREENKEAMIDRQFDWSRRSKINE